MKLSLLPVAAAVTLAATAQADTTALPEVVVTATRGAELATTLPNVSVITRDDIDTRQPSSLADLLAQEAGIHVTANGGPLTATGIFIRSAAGKQVLVLVDGVRVNDANQGAFDFSLIRPDDIERIEIVRGPYSSQYGSDAIGGVIQIFTRKSDKAELSARLGRHGTQEYNAGARLGSQANGISLRAGYLDTDGFSATTPDSVFSYDPDDDGGLARTVQLSGNASPTDHLTLEFSSSWKEGRTEYDIGFTEQDHGTASASATLKTTDSWSQTLQLGWLRNRLDSDGRTDPFAYFSRFFTERQSVSWLHNITFNNHLTLVAGIDHASEDAESVDLLNQVTAFEKRTHNTGLFATQHAQFGIYSGSVSLRQDKHDSFGEHTSGSTTVAAQVTPAIKLYGAYGSAFRAPSANDLYYPGFFGMFAGNPALEPEKSRQSELGAEYRQGLRYTRISAYRNIVKNLIASDPSFPFNQANINSARLQGIELETGGRLDAIAYKFNVSSQSSEDGNGQDLSHRPQGSLNGSVTYAINDALSIGTDVQARSTILSGGQELPRYAIMGLHAGWNVSPSLTLGARLDNVGDKEYQQVYTYGTSRRSGYVTMNWRWQ